MDSFPFHPPAKITHAVHVVLSLVFLAALFVTGGCSISKPAIRGEGPDASLAVPPPADIAAGQMIVVVGEGRGNIRARLYALERVGDDWRLFKGPLPAMVGRHGFAAPGEKVEGDGKTPSGIFPLEFVFGYDSRGATRMPYRQATTDDLWVDDPASPDYNTWVRRGGTAARSYEVMRLPDKQYRHGVVIGYNRYPIVKGKGSAIFLHVWLEEGRATAGCVSLEEGELVDIVKWLDPDRTPMILMGDAGDLPAITARVKGAAP